VEIGNLCSREVFVANREEPLAQAVREMHQRKVGMLVVVERQGKRFLPVGIVTDRDALCRQLMRQADLFTLVVEDVMTPDPVTVSEHSDLTEAIQSMRARGVRRAPVLSDTGELVGVVSLDDLLPAVSRELCALAALVGTQARHEAATA